jgi:hypothetical protein
MATVDEIRAKCPDVSFKQKEDGSWTCRFFRNHRCIAAGHDEGDCLVFPAQQSLPAEPVSAPENDVLGIGTGTTGEAGNVDESPGSAPSQDEEPRPAWDMTWSASRLGTFLRCPYKFYLHYILGLRASREPDWALYGRAMHTALENYISGEGLTFESTGRDKVDAQIAGKLEGLNEAGVLVDIMRADDWRVEERVDFEYEHAPDHVQSNRIRWTARLDLVNESGSIIADWKGTGKSPSKMRMLDILHQMSDYCMAVPTAETVLINAILKPKLEFNPRKESAEAYQDRVRRDVVASPNKYFFQHRYSRSEVQPERHFAVMNELVTRIIECIKAGESAFPRNASDCSFGAPCDLEDECVRRL